MNALKRAISLLAVALLLSVVCLPLAGCDGKRDIAIRLGARSLHHLLYQAWTFPVGTDEIHDEMQYTGYELRIQVEGYCFQGGVQWFVPLSSGNNTISVSSNFLYTDLDGKQHKVESILEKGTYVINCSANSGSTLWHGRRIRLFLTVI